MDPEFAQQSHSGAFPNSGNDPPSLPDRSFGVPYNHAPEEVDGALRYTPLTSVVPVSGVLNALPAPQFACFYPTQLTMNPDQQQRTQGYFDVLNRNPQNNAEAAFQKEEFRNVVSLLKQVDDRHFRFKTPPHFSNPPPQVPSMQPPFADLGPFAQGVLEETTTNFRYPTPLTPETVNMPLDRTPQPPSPHITSAINLMQVVDPSRLHSSFPQASPKRQSFAVEIPARPMQPTPSSSIASSNYKRQKISHDHAPRESSSPTPTRSVMEKDRVDAMVTQFTTLLEDIFEAEDAFNPEAETPSEGSLAFFSHDSLREQKPWLSREVHRKLDFHLRRLAKTATGKVSVDTGDLARISGICERAVKAAEVLDLKNIDDGEDADREWTIGKLSTVENAILAANVIMLLIAGRGIDQQIYSEETLKSIVEVLRIFLDCIFQWIAAGTTENSASDTLAVAITCTKQISALLQNSITLLSQFEIQLAETVSQETIVNVLQFLAVEAIFLENQAKDKETVISNQGIESLRVISTGILRQIFASYPDQRTFILDEVLSSLAKLPANRQQSRHFKLLDGRSIQLVSALMMRLVQACGGCFNVRNVDLTLPPRDDEPDAELALRNKRVNLYADEWSRAAKAANQSATYIINYLTSRALQTRTTAPTDSPFKALLDIFAEDFLTVLTAPEWPAAELLLRSLIKNLYVCIDGDNHGAQVKNVALDAVGQVAAKIRAVRKKLTAQLSSRTDEDTDTTTLIARVAEYATGPSLTMQELSDLQETYRIVWAKADSGMRDAIRFQVCSWGNFVLSTDRVDEDEPTSSRRSAPLIESLGKIARAGKADFDSLSLPSDLEVSLACTVLLTRSPLFQSWDNMLSRILRSMSEKQPTFRTKALRALGQVILCDPDILSLTNVQQQVALRISDPSPAVREAAIELVSKHIASDPVLGKKYYEVMRARINDAGLGVRKRVIKLLKDIYFKSDEEAMQTEIASSILSRITDEEHSVRELSVKTMEELWFMSPGEEIDMAGTFDFVRLNIKAQKTIRTRTMAMARVLGEGDERKVILFRRCLRTMCAETGKPGKSVQARFDACKLSVHCLYDVALNSASEGKMANFKRCLLVVSLFAKTTPSVFSVEHMTSLEPYLKGSTEKDDQEIAYLVVLIYRTLLAQAQLTFQPEFLTRAMTTIATSMTSVSLKHLKESVPAVCLIAGMLNDYSNVIRVVQTCFRVVKNSERTIDAGGSSAGSTTLIRCLYLLGLFAQHARIDQRSEQFTVALGVPRNVSITGLIAKSLAVFTKAIVPEALRKIAVTSYGFLCLGNSEFFKSETGDAQQIIRSSLRDGSIVLKRTILEIFQDYFAIEEHKAESMEGIKKDDVDLSSDIGVLTGTATSVATDEASFFLAGNFLADIMECSLSDSAPLAITATEVFECIACGGLAAPNDVFPTLVALETSPIARVRQIASRTRSLLSTRREDVIDDTYLESLTKLFDYRKTVVKSAKGRDHFAQMLTAGYYMYNGEPVSLIASLYKDVKTKKRVRVKYLRGLVNQLDRDSQSKGATAGIEVDFARFIVENLLHLEYGVIEEVFTVIYTIDRIISVTGITLLQAIETGDTTESIGVLAQRSIVFSLMIGLKQHLKMAYNLTEAKCRAFDPKKMGAAKDNKPALRVHSVGIVDWPEIPYLEMPFENDVQIQEQLNAYLNLIRCDEVAGSLEFTQTSDDDLQASAKEDDSQTKSDEDSVGSQTNGTPSKKPKKGNGGSEMGSAKKKQKTIPL